MEALLQTFEAHYSKKEYEAAIASLKSVERDLHPAVFHYNLATVYSRMDKWADARYEFLKARQWNNSLENLEQNISIVEDKLEVTRLEKPLSAVDYLVKAGFVAHEGILTSLSLIILLIGLITLRKAATLPKVIGWVGLIALPAILTLWIGSWPVSLTREVSYLSEGPSALFTSNHEIPAGIMVIAVGESEWKKIIYPSRFSGWIKDKSLRKL